jgi:sugar lactone lactonase YvrE
MSLQTGRYAVSRSPSLAAGWTLERLTPTSRLFGANGLRTGPDGRIYVAQVSGSQISAIDVASGQIETISPKGGDIVAPDDLVFDPQGNLYATEITEGRVSVRAPDGRTRVLCGDMPCANPITFHQGRLFAGECRPGGRILELDLGGGAPRVLLDNVPMPNAMEVGPDGMLYFPVMGTNEIWRVGLDGGAPETVAGDLGVPDAVKFDSRGYIVSTQVASGQVLRIDPRTGARTVLAEIAPGLDNLTFVGDRLFVSSISGQINEILGDGRIRSLVPDGLNWPLGLAMDADGVLLVADGGFTYTLRPGGTLQRAGVFFSPGYPGYVRGVTVSGLGEYIVTTANGEVARWRPALHESEVLAEGFDRLYGVAVAAGGAVIFAEAGTGRVLSVRSGNVEVLTAGLREPMGVAIAADGACLVSEEGAGRVLKLSGGSAETVLDGLQKPQGILVRGELLYVVDAGARELVEYDLARKAHRTIATGLPVGAPPGVTPKFLRAILPLSGPMGPFAGIAAGVDGTLYISADADGSILALRPAHSSPDKNH